MSLGMCRLVQQHLVHHPMVSRLSRSQSQEPSQMERHYLRRSWETSHRTKTPTERRYLHPSQSQGMSRRLVQSLSYHRMVSQMERRCLHRRQSLGTQS